MSVLKEIQDEAPCSDHPLQTTRFRLLQRTGKRLLQSTTHEKIRTVHHQVMPTKMQKKPPSISTHSRTRQKRLRSPEPPSWHDWGATTLRHAVKFRRGEKSSGVYQFGFMIPTAAPTGRREPVGDEATITPRRANHNLGRKDSKEATSTALTANSYDPA